MKVLENSPAGRQLKHIDVQISDGTSEPIPSAAVIRASDNNVTSSLLHVLSHTTKSILGNTESIQQVQDVQDNQFTTELKVFY